MITRDAHMNELQSYFTPPTTISNRIPRLNGYDNGKINVNAKYLVYPNVLVAQWIVFLSQAYGLGTLSLNSSQLIDTVTIDGKYYHYFKSYDVIRYDTGINFISAYTGFTKAIIQTRTRMQDIINSLCEYFVATDVLKPQAENPNPYFPCYKGYFIFRNGDGYVDNVVDVKKTMIDLEQSPPNFDPNILIFADNIALTLLWYLEPLFYSYLLGVYSQYHYDDQGSVIDCSDGDSFFSRNSKDSKLWGVSSNSPSNYVDFVDQVTLPEQTPFGNCCNFISNLHFLLANPYQTNYIIDSNTNVDYSYDGMSSVSSSDKKFRTPSMKIENTLYSTNNANPNYSTFSILPQYVAYATQYPNGINADELVPLDLWLLSTLLVQNTYPNTAPFSSVSNSNGTNSNMIVKFLYYMFKIAIPQYFNGARTNNNNGRIRKSLSNRYYTVITEFYNKLTPISATDPDTKIQYTFNMEPPIQVLDKDTSLMGIFTPPSISNATGSDVLKYEDQHTLFNTNGYFNIQSVSSNTAFPTNNGYPLNKDTSNDILQFGLSSINDIGIYPDQAPSTNPSYTDIMGIIGSNNIGSS